MQTLNIALVGAGLVGQDHLRMIADNQDCQLVAIVDPTEAARSQAAELNVAYFNDLPLLLAQTQQIGGIDGIILATPNQLHADQAKQCIAAGIPAIIEKPVTESVAAGQELLELAANSNVPMMVGHHRMHSPIMRVAKQAISDGRLGALVAVNGSAMFYKPDDYFAAGPWRTQPGGGPILINLIHERGNLCYLCGDITSVQAVASNARRGFVVEDTVGILLTFDSGVIGTFILSDTAVSGRSWEQTSQENPYFASTPDEDCYHLAGTKGALSIPTLRYKHYGASASSWNEPFLYDTIALARRDPLAEQLAHFCQVIRGEVDPLVSVHDGLQNLRVTEAIVAAAESGERVTLS